VEGYFNIIRDVDEFLLLEDVQYTWWGWRNRSRIKTARGLKWLTIPVDIKGNYFIQIKDVLTAITIGKNSIVISLFLYGRNKHALFFFNSKVAIVCRNVLIYETLKITPVISEHFTAI
jgi:hypothetical protein